MFTQQTGALLLHYVILSDASTVTHRRQKSYICVAKEAWCKAHFWTQLEEPKAPLDPNWDANLLLKHPWMLGMTNIKTCSSQAWQIVVIRITSTQTSVSQFSPLNKVVNLSWKPAATIPYTHYPFWFAWEYFTRRLCMYSIPNFPSSIQSFLWMSPWIKNIDFKLKLKVKERETSCIL